MEVDPRRLRNCLGHFATGVTVVTCDGDDGHHGATVNAFMAVSLDPPLVQVSLDRRGKACEYITRRAFAVNVLAEHQHDVALHFAGRPNDVEVSWCTGGGTPALTGCIARIYCRPWRTYDGGDHLLVLGEVERFDSADGAPLVFYSGKFRAAGQSLEGTPWIDSLDCPSGSGWFGPQYAARLFDPVG